VVAKEDLGWQTKTLTSRLQSEISLTSWGEGQECTW